MGAENERIEGTQARKNGHFKGDDINYNQINQESPSPKLRVFTVEYIRFRMARTLVHTWPKWYLLPHSRGLGIAFRKKNRSF